jgi:uncharacterized membrane protein YeaQ/YmgE (transglycosylase-associated protein family)
MTTNMGQIDRIVRAVVGAAVVIWVDLKNYIKLPRRR